MVSYRKAEAYLRQFGKVRRVPAWQVVAYLLVWQIQAVIDKSPLN